MSIFSSRVLLPQQLSMEGASDAISKAAEAIAAALPKINRSALFAAKPAAARAVVEDVAMPVAPDAPRCESASFNATMRACSDPKWLASHGPSFTILREQQSLIEAPFTQVHAIPSPSYTASNYAPGRHAEELYYVNGMNVGPRDMEAHLASLVKTFGRPVTAVINGEDASLDDPRRPSMLRSVWHAACGLLSADAGRRVEGAAVTRVEQAIEEHVKAGQPLHLVAHSQGSIIVANAIERMLSDGSPLSPEERERARALVRVSTFGAAEHYFPAGIRVQEYAHAGDQVSWLTGKLTDLREGVKGAWGTAKSAVRSGVGQALEWAGISTSFLKPSLEKSRAPVAMLPGDHAFGPYLDKIPGFFIEKHGEGSPHAGLRVAEDLRRSIMSGQLSDVMHGMIIAEMIGRNDRLFARELLGKSEHGHIGAFKIPFADRLKILAGRL